MARTVVIEALEPLNVRFRGTGTAYRLQPGQPVSLPEPQAQRLLAAASDKVRLVSEPPPDWPALWRSLAAATAGLRTDDPRLHPVLSALVEAERAYKAEDLLAFQHAADRVQFLMTLQPSRSICWRAADGTLRGPAVIEHVHADAGRLWCYVTFGGLGRWVHEQLIAHHTEGR